MEDRELHERAVLGTRAFARTFGMARGAEVHELRGVTAAIVPSCPERSVVNCVGYDSAQHLEPALDELAELYAAAGVHAWTVCCLLYTSPSPRD